MRYAVGVLALVCSVAAAAPAPSDPVHAFATRWPKVAGSLTPALSRVLFTGKPCGDDLPGPPITDVTKASVSTDGKTLVVIADFDLDDDGAKLLAAADAERDARYALVFDGPSGAWRASALTMWNGCNGNPVDWTWSQDNRHVLAALDSGHGIRSALFDVRTRTLVATGFDDMVLPSPHLVHLAHTPWFSGRPSGQDESLVNGTMLLIDGREVWGSSDDNGATIWAVEWKSDERLEFCGLKPQLAPARYRVTVGVKPSVARVAGSCPIGD